MYGLNDVFERNFATNITILFFQLHCHIEVLSSVKEKVQLNMTVSYAPTPMGEQCLMTVPTEHLHSALIAEMLVSDVKVRNH